MKLKLLKENVAATKINNQGKMQTKQLVEEREHRTKLIFFHESLMMVKREAGNLHEELMQLIKEGDISFKVDKCSSEINEQLISRRNDTPSNTM